ncbi:hypothetical protein Efla_003402 [Eimeria flavescens]
MSRAHQSVYAPVSAARSTKSANFIDKFFLSLVKLNPINHLFKPFMASEISQLLAGGPPPFRPLGVDFVQLATAFHMRLQNSVTFPLLSSDFRINPEQTDKEKDEDKDKEDEHRPQQLELASSVRMLHFDKCSVFARTRQVIRWKCAPALLKLPRLPASVRRQQRGSSSSVCPFALAQMPAAAAPPLLFAAQSPNNLHACMQLLLRAVRPLGPRSLPASSHCCMWKTWREGCRKVRKKCKQSNMRAHCLNIAACTGRLSAARGFPPAACVRLCSDSSNSPSLFRGAREEAARGEAAAACTRASRLASWAVLAPSICSVSAEQQVAAAAGSQDGRKLAFHKYESHANAELPAVCSSQLYQ